MPTSTGSLFPLLLRTGHISRSRLLPLSFYHRHSRSISLMSRPPTPQSKAPADRSEWRFNHISADTEWVEAYRPGGLHPVHLGDTLGNRYKIIRKLGYGAFSTVWLARDTQTNQYAAIKIGVARASETNNELNILQHLAQHRNDVHSGSKHVLELLHGFETEGPNGRHVCLVLPVMGPSANTMLRRFRNPETREERYPLWVAKSMLKQVLQGLSFLHTIGIVHTDVQPGNILFSLPNIDSLPESELATDITQPQTISKPITRVDGKADLWAPQYTAIPQPLEGLASLGPDFTVRISDLGGATFISCPATTTPITPAGLRAPELIFGKTWDPSIDIWSFGCLLFEFVAGTPLFCLDLYGTTPEEVDDEHLMLMIDVLGPLPANLRQEWTRYSEHYDDNGNPLVDLEFKTLPLEKQLLEQKPVDMNEEEVKVVGELLRGILQYEPEKRLKAEELLRHPWFEGIGKEGV